MFARSIAGLPAGIVFQAPGTETGQRASAPTDVFIDVTEQPSQDVAESGDVGAAFAMATPAQAPASSKGWLASLGRLAAMVTGRASVSTNSIQQPMTREEVIKKIETLLDDAHKLPYSRIGHEVNDPKLWSRSIDMYRDAIALMKGHSIHSVKAPGGEVATTADILMSIAYAYEHVDQDKGSCEYVNAHDEYVAEGRPVDAVNALWRREAALSILHGQDYYVRERGGDAAVVAAYRKHAAAFKDFLAAYFHLPKADQDKYAENTSLSIDWHLKWFAEALTGAQMYEEAIEIYGVLAGLKTGYADEIRRLLADPVSSAEIDRTGLFGLGCLFASKFMWDDRRDAAKFVSKRVELLQLLGRFEQMAREMAPVVFVLVESGSHTHHDFVHKFVTAHPEFAEIALENAAVGCRSAGHHGCAAGFEKMLMEYLTAKSDHVALAEAQRRMAWDYSSEIMRSFDGNWGPQYTLWMDRILHTADALTKYGDELVAGGEFLETSERIVEIRARADQLRGFHEKRHGLEMVWTESGVATLAPLAGMRAFLGISDALVINGSGFWAAIARSRLPE